MERRHFNRLVSSLMKALYVITEKKLSTPEALCILLSWLNTINKSKKLIPCDKFYLHNLQSEVDMSNDFAQWAYKRKKGTFYWSDYPFLWNAELKTYLLQYEAHLQMEVFLFIEFFHVKQELEMIIFSKVVLLFHSLAV
ncbi:unnamed protein product [Gongylonema pulchrum]|uniref:Transposase n=1 Tax=Gongylonema pulchrum TaxID=637853 RepID=A0A183EMK3_9BILA|nr:unnamed protein product [Gongylonema pulchrum]